MFNKIFQIIQYVAVMWLVVCIADLLIHGKNRFTVASMSNTHQRYDVRKIIPTHRNFNFGEFMIKGNRIQKRKNA